MGVKVYIDGALLGEAEATIPVWDRGFLYGDSVYEVMRTAGGRPVDLSLHLERLVRSAASIALSVPSPQVLREAISRTLEAAGNDDSYVRIVVTRGSGDIGLDTALADHPRTLVIVRPLALPPDSAYREGVRLQVVEVQRTPRRAMDPAVKSGNYLNNILALAEARKAGAYEALMCDARGRIAEGSSSNLFVVAGGVITTPALDIGLLAGITRARVLELARGAGLEVVEGTVTPAQARAAEEAFITSSIRGVLPVAHIDDARMPLGAPGPLTRRLMDLYAEHLAAVARGSG
jgi:branched-chain amino acid aminotransferase